jgi:alkanesulfonate monooxygenase SsuD/methylene tetrahydromethanopterin reductase-like flavin-dependent oxidoreductase (luciferase family)
VRIAPSTIGLKPLQRPRPPLLLAAYTPAGLDRIARRADGWAPAGLPVEALAPMWSTLCDMAVGRGRGADELALVVRANVKLTDRPLDSNRPSYWGSCEQVADDLVATRAAGAHEVILDLHSDARTATELLDLASELAATTMLVPAL